jgi:chromosome segregation protein
MHIPKRIVGLVGPNGCGKSNIIDAVRWVMGESAAGHLRGTNMEDVIFNGSSKRKPVNQATVELVFENNDGRVTGPWAEYNEISVRRLVERGAGSSYYINGTKCRRRDVMDIFLGTGLGPRSYSIIEQGMISRVIDAKPEELRVFIEEAAGVSRYKERRRETENRIRHTEENLARLVDLMQEVQKQADRAARQAKAAERFRRLRDEEREYRQAVYVLTYQSHDEAHRAFELKILESEKEISKLRADQRRLESTLISSKSADMAKQKELEDAQRLFYEQKSVVEKLEQKIEFIKTAQQRADQNAQALAQELSRLQAQKTQAIEQLEIQQQQFETLTEQCEQLAEQKAELEQQREETKAALQESDEKLRAYQSTKSAKDRDRSLLELQSQQLQKESERNAQDQQKLSDEQNALQSKLSDSGQDVDLEALATLREQVEQLEATLEQTDQSYQDSRQQAHLQRQQLEEHRGRLNTSRGKLEALRTLQRNQLSAEDAKKSHKIPKLYQDAPHLTEALEVEAGWEQALEVILADWLTARVVGKYPDVSDGEQLLQSRAGIVVDATGKQTGIELTNRLSGKLKQAPLSVLAFCQSVHIVDNLASALQKVSQIEPHETVITPEGYWLSSMGIKPSGDQNSVEHSLIYRQRVIAELETEVAELLQSVQTQEQKAQQTAANRDNLEKQLAELKQQNTQQQSALSKLTAESLAKEQQQSERENRLTAIQQSLESTAETAEQLAMQREEIQAKLAVTLAELSESQAEEAPLQEAKIAAEVAFEEIDRQFAQLNVEFQQYQLRQTRTEAEIESLKKSEKDLHERVTKMEQTQTAALETDQKIELESLVESLQEALELQKSKEDVWQELKEDSEKGKLVIGEQETTLAALRESISETDSVKQSLVLQSTERQQQGKYQIERLQEMGVTLYAAQKQLEVRETLLTKAEAEEQANSLKQKIDQMGAVNLQAIEEHEELTERLNYLTEQLDDLNEALSTLKEAIASIDEETKERFQQTFDAVNEQVKVLFPRLFGGGKARLELTSDDMLTAGIRIMARPPGKKPASIQLLSGGEKALTAAALVFGIFQLNPSPFCMLDEVDAPLDDANVGRFCELVKSLADKVQFIIVTHNKVTMETADQLAGVTMGEPGVSRLVSVDIDDAVALAG